jgi:hypothetical protein
MKNFEIVLGTAAMQQIWTMFRVYMVYTAYGFRV